MLNVSRKWNRWIAIAVLSAFLPLSTGCFGKFELLRKVYKFNQEVDEDKWIQEFVFLILAIFPIYGLASLLDVLLFNSVEFWTGESIITSDTTRRVVGENGEIASATFHPDGTIDLLLIDADGNQSELFFERGAEGLTAFDDQGRALARAKVEDGRVQLTQLH